MAAHHAVAVAGVTANEIDFDPSVVEMGAIVFPRRVDPSAARLAQVSFCFVRRYGGMLLLTEWSSIIQAIEQLVNLGR
jgi:hypothetical protein